jgi:hypothetical protein
MSKTQKTAEKELAETPRLEADDGSIIDPVYSLEADPAGIRDFVGSTIPDPGTLTKAQQQKMEELDKEIMDPQHIPSTSMDGIDDNKETTIGGGHIPK